MKAKVIKRFKDKFTRDLYVPGDLFEGSKERVEYLIELEYLQPTSDYNSMTRKEILKLLDEKNIKYNPKAKKEDLIELLKGGD